MPFAFAAVGPYALMIVVPGTSSPIACLDEYMSQAGMACVVHTQHESAMERTENIMMCENASSSGGQVLVDAGRYKYHNALQVIVRRISEYPLD